MVRLPILVRQYLKYKNFDELLILLVSYYYQNWIVGATVARIKQPSFNILKALKKNYSIADIKAILNENLKNYNTTVEYKKVINSSNVYDNKKWIKPVLLLIEYFLKDDSNQSFISLNKKIEVTPEKATSFTNLTFIKKEKEVLFLLEDHFGLDYKFIYNLKDKDGHRLTQRRKEGNISFFSDKSVSVIKMIESLLDKAYVQSMAFSGS